MDVGYYDLVMAIIPIIMGTGVISGIVVESLVLNSTVAVAGVLAFAVVGHAIFVNPPVRSSPSREFSVSGARVEQ